MGNYIGFLIKKTRIRQGFTQEGLCSGICAVSYLSKIEKGVVSANQEIVDKLLRRLGVEFTFDEAAVKDGERLFYAFFDGILYSEDREAEREAIGALAGQLENSVLSMTYRIYLIYTERNTEVIRREIAFLSQFVEYMSDWERFWFYHKSGIVAKGFAAKMEMLNKANEYGRYSINVFRMAKNCLTQGMYQEAVLFANNALTLAYEEGNVRTMINAALLIGHSYASINNVDLMLKSYAHAANLARGVDCDVKKQTDYNTGAVFVSMGRYEDAMPLLINALGTVDTEMRIMVFHKLAIACVETGKTAEGLDYLEQGYALLNDNPDEMFTKLFDLVRMRTTDNYLDSAEYGDLLQEIYRDVGTYGFGFKIFHVKYMIRYYVYHRKYKEAYNLSVEYVNFLEHST